MMDDEELANAATRFATEHTGLIPEGMPIAKQGQSVSREEQLLNQYRAKVRDLDQENISMRLYLAKMRVLDFWLLDEITKESS